LGRAVAGLLDGSLKVVDVQRGEQGISARIKGTRDEYTVYIEGRRVHCSCRDFYERRCIASTPQCWRSEAWACITTRPGALIKNGNTAAG